jgi:hypothetical protein
VRSDEHLPHNVYDLSSSGPGFFVRVLLGLDIQDPSKAPALASAEVALDSTWEIGQDVAEHVHNVGCGSESFVDNSSTTSMILTTMIWARHLNPQARKPIWAAPVRLIRPSPTPPPYTTLAFQFQAGCDV